MYTVSTLHWFPSSPPCMVLNAKARKERFLRTCSLRSSLPNLLSLPLLSFVCCCCCSFPFMPYTDDTGSLSLASPTSEPGEVGGRGSAPVVRCACWDVCWRLLEQREGGRRAAKKRRRVRRTKIHMKRSQYLVKRCLQRNVFYCSSSDRYNNIWGRRSNNMFRYSSNKGDHCGSNNKNSSCVLRSILTAKLRSRSNFRFSYIRQ